MAVDRHRRKGSCLLGTGNGDPVSLEYLASPPTPDLATSQDPLGLPLPPTSTLYSLWRPVVPWGSRGEAKNVMKPTLTPHETCSRPALLWPQGPSPPAQASSLSACRDMGLAAQGPGLGGSIQSSGSSAWL